MNLENGLNLNVNPIDQPQGSYRDARNFVLSVGMANEDGFDYLFDLPAQPVGVIPLNNDEWVVFCYDATYDEIGIVSNNVYTRILKTTSSSDRLNLSTSFPVKGKFRVSSKSERVITFTDNNNPPRILNIDTLPFPVDVNKVPTAVNSISLLNTFSAGDPPTISYTLSQTGGFLKSGAYYFTTSYTTVDGSDTGFSTKFGPIKINDDNSGTATYDGCVANTTSSKVINLVIYGVDTRFKYLNIGVVSTIGGETKFKRVGKIEIVPSTFTYNFSFVGNEQTTTLLLEQATASTAGLYDKAKTIAVVDDQLVLGNLSSRAPYDYQSYANAIYLRYNVSIFDCSSLSSLMLSSNLQQGGFRAFEVYAFYIAFRYKDGSYTPAYHIPGRAALGGDTATSSLLGTAKKFQVEDTCLTNGTMSYWENENEFYPNNFPDFAGQPVRHHKFPSLNFVMNNAATLGVSALSTRMGLDLMPIISFDAYNVVIPADLLAQVEGWQIFYAKRDINNMTCVGQGHLNFCYQNGNNTSDLVPNSNIHVGLGNFKMFNNTKPLKTKLAFHSPDLLLNKPSIAPSYVRNEIKLSAVVGAAYTANIQSNADPVIEALNDSGGAGYLEQYGLINYTNLTGGIAAVPSVSGDLIRTVNTGSSLYMAPNVISGSYYNIQSSEYIALDITSASTLTIASNLNSNYMSSVAAIIDRREDTYLSNLCQLVKTVYSSFSSQSLIAATDVVDTSVTNTGFGVVRTGDNYLADYSSVTTIFKDTDPLGSDTITAVDTAVNTVARGIKYIRRYVTECNINIKFRHEDLDNNSKYYGKSNFKINNSTDLQNSFLRNWDVSKGQIISYNSDYSVVNSLNAVFPRNTSISTISRFPFRVIASERNANELLDSGWRTFLANNYFDMVTTKGEISNLEAYGEMLFIHLKNTLYRTVTRQTMEVGTINVSIGSGNIFDQSPSEILISELGYLGNQNLFGCGMTKLGYVFFDVSQGKLFAVGNDIKELSDNGLTFFFRDNLLTNTVGDNPFTSTGVTMAYDELYNRLLVSKKGTSSFTLSYSPDANDGKGAWVSFHDYTPDYMFNTRTKVYSFKGLKVYQHNSATKTAAYYDGTIYPSYIVPVMNEAPNDRKYFRSINWKSEIQKLDGTSIFNKTFTKIMLYNSYQCSGDIAISYPLNIFNAETTWNFNNFYDIVRDRSLPFMNASGLITSNLNSTLAWYKQRRFVDKWVAVKFLYDNIDQNMLFLYDVSALMRKSER